MEEVCIVTLSERGVEDTAVFPLHVYRWIVRPFNPPNVGDSSYWEPVPDDIKPHTSDDFNGSPPSKVMVTRGSWDNDRALSLRVGGKNAMSLQDAIEYCRVNDLKVEETFIGLYY